MLQLWPYEAIVKFPQEWRLEEDDFCELPNAVLSLPLHSILQSINTYQETFSTRSSSHSSKKRMKLCHLQEKMNGAREHVK